MWTRSARVLAAALLAALALTGCSGDDDGDDKATDTSGTSTEESPPPAEPTVGTYPAFEAEDYAYTLQVSCFCPDAGVPIRVTVEGGEVSEAVYGDSGQGKGGGHQAGDPAPEYQKLSINDIIDAANAATDAESVIVKWPDGQDYPNEVYIDQDARMADEEIGYTVSDVAVG